jgi:hypothetical protein
VFLIAFCGGFVLSLIIFVLNLIESTRDFAKFSASILRLFLTPFNFCNALMNVSNVKMIQYREGLTEPLSVWDSRVAGLDFWLMLFQTVFYIILLVVLENIKYVRSISNFYVTKQLLLPGPLKGAIDQDVAAEAERVK